MILSINKHQVIFVVYAMDFPLLKMPLYFFCRAKKEMIMSEFMCTTIVRGGIIIIISSLCVLYYMYKEEASKRGSTPRSHEGGV